MLPIVCVFIVLVMTSAAPQGSDLITFPNLPDGLIPGGVTPPAGMSEIGQIPQIGEIGQIGQIGQIDQIGQIGEIDQVDVMISQLPDIGDANAMGGMITQAPGIGNMGNINDMMSTPSAMGGIMSQVPSNQIPGCGGSTSNVSEDSAELEPETLPSDSTVMTA